MKLAIANYDNVAVFPRLSCERVDDQDDNDTLKHDVAVAARQCLDLLDAIDAKVVSTGVYSTPYDPELEALRSQCEALAAKTGVRLA